MPYPEGGPVKDIIGILPYTGGGVRYEISRQGFHMCSNTFLYRTPPLRYRTIPEGGPVLDDSGHIALYRMGGGSGTGHYWVPFYLVGFRIPMPDPGDPV